MVFTCWHCLTGADPKTGQSLSKRTGARPNRANIRLLGRGPGHFVHSDQKLYDESGAAVWLVHPLGSGQVDLAAFELSGGLSPESFNRPMNEIEQDEIRIEIGSDLFAIGFPKNLSPTGLPIWKRASVASELTAITHFGDDRVILVDTATREGLSGAPVIARRYGTYIAENGNMLTTAGSNTKFVGVYSGRLGGDDAMAAQVGRVWPASYVTELMQSGSRDKLTD